MRWTVLRAQSATQRPPSPRAIFPILPRISTDDTISPVAASNWVKPSAWDTHRLGG